MIPREFVYAGAAIVWVFGFATSFKMLDGWDEAEGSLKTIGCLFWLVTIVFLTVIVYLLAAGTMRYAE